jgi:hypothetical protein
VAVLKYPYPSDITQPPQGGFTITPNDGADLAEAARGLWCEGGGTVKFNFLDGSGPFTWTLPACQQIGMEITKVFLTGTTATGITGLR